MLRLTRDLQFFFEYEGKAVFPGLVGSPERPSTPPYRTRGAVSKLASSTGGQGTSSSPVKTTRSNLTSVSSLDTLDEDHHYPSRRRPPPAVASAAAAAANRRSQRTRSKRGRPRIQSTSSAALDSSDAEENASVGSRASTSSYNEFLTSTPPPTATMRQTRSMKRRLPSSLTSSGNTAWTTDEEESGFSMTLRNRSQHSRKRKAKLLDNSDEDEDQDGDESEEEEEEEEEDEMHDDEDDIDEDDDEEENGESSVERDSEDEESAPVVGRRSGRNGGTKRPMRKSSVGQRTMMTISFSGRQLRKRRKVVRYSEDEEDMDDYDMEIPITVTSRSGRIVKPTSKFI